MYQCEAISENCSVRFYINGVCLVSSNQFKNNKNQILLDPYLITGVNLAHIEFEVTKENQNAEYMASIKVSKYDQGKTQVLFLLTTAQEGSKPNRQLGWNQKAMKFEATSYPWLWLNSPQVDISANDMNEIILLLQSFYNALVKKDVTNILHLTRVKLKEIALARGKPISEIEQQDVELFDLVFDEDFELLPIISENISIEIEANGRIVHILDKVHGNVIREKEGVGFSVDIRVAKITSKELGVNNQWMIIR